MGDPQPTASPEGRPETVRCEISPSFPDWLRAAGGSIALTTYQAGKVGMIGWDGRQVTFLFRDFPKPMGLDVNGPRLLLATRHHLIELGNDPLLAHDFLEGQPGRYDALYLPRVTHATGDLNVHDVAYGADGPWMVNTRFSCLAGTRPRLQLRAAMAAAVRLGNRPRGPLPPQRAGDAGRRAAVRHGPGRHRRRGWLASG